jgi:endo-1,4-beta-xylanase
MSAILSSKKSGANITALVFWGLSDDHSWRSKDKPLLYSNYSTPKEAYY